MKTDGPIDFDGNFSKLDIAWIGGARKNKPSMWALGGGPKLIDIACAKADGFTTVVPFAWPTPERAAEEIRQIREKVEAGGRDPDEFEFAVLRLYRYRRQLGPSLGLSAHCHRHRFRRGIDRPHA